MGSRSDQCYTHLGKSQNVIDNQADKSKYYQVSTRNHTTHTTKQNHKTNIDVKQQKKRKRKKKTKDMRRPQLKTVYRREPRLGGMSARQSEAASFISATNGHNRH